MSQSQVARLTSRYIIEVENLSCAVDGYPILRELSFRVPAGSFCCLLGKSGCGKTTLFRALSGLNALQTGTIRINGTTVVENAVSYVPSHQRKVGLVFQDYTLFPHLSVRDNLLFGAPKCSRLEQQQMIDHLLKLVSLQGYEERFPHELSGGQQQRIALARTLASDPLLVLLDEPFSNLEQEQRWHLAKQVKRILRQQSVSAVLVTHDQKEAFVFADYIGIMMDGKLIQWGTPEDIYYRPKNERIVEFIGSGDWYDCQVSVEDGGYLATPFGIVRMPEEGQLTAKAKALLQQSADSTMELQIFLRQENIYLHLDQDQPKQDMGCYLSAKQKKQLPFPIVKQWQVIEKSFGGFLTFVTLQAVLEKERPCYASTQTQINTFVLSHRNIQMGQKVELNLELGAWILRAKP